MDDGTIASELATIKSDLSLLIQESKNLGLQLNLSKCEVFNGDDDQIFPSMKKITDRTFELLGSPITQSCLNDCLERNKSVLQKRSEKLSILPFHHAFKILQSSFGSPRLISILRCSLCF